MQSCSEHTPALLSCTVHTLLKCSQATCQQHHAVVLDGQLGLCCPALPVGQELPPLTHAAAKQPAASVLVGNVLLQIMNTRTIPISVTFCASIPSECYILLACTAQLSSLYGLQPPYGMRCAACAAPPAYLPKPPPAAAPSLHPASPNALIS